jgi:hypothetical protein
MTQALNMALLGNNVNTSGQVLLANGVSGTLPVANGGTGASTLTANNVLLGNGTSAPQFVAPGTSGNVLTSNGTTWTSTAPTSAAPTTAQVLSATAGATVGAVGTYAMLGSTNTTEYAAGATLAGSLLRYCGLAGNTSWSNNLVPESTSAYGVGNGGTPSGTWRVMGRISVSGFGIYGATLCLRIS